MILHVYILDVKQVTLQQIDLELLTQLNLCQTDKYSEMQKNYIYFY